MTGDRIRGIVIFAVGIVVGGIAVFAITRALTIEGTPSAGEASARSVPAPANPSALPDGQSALPGDGATADAGGQQPANQGPGSEGGNQLSPDSAATEPPSTGPGASPPAPRPSISAPPRTVACQVAILAGPAPGGDNIRLVVTTTSEVPLLWATVEQEGRKVNGAIAIAGGRGEQVVNGFTQAARVTVFADSALDPSTASCRIPSS